MDEAVAFASVHDQLLAITDLGRLLAGRCAFVQAAQRGDLDPHGQSRGHEIAREVARYLGGAGEMDDSRERAKHLANTIDAAFGGFVARLAATIAAGRELPIQLLARAFGLSEVEIKIVIALAAAEIEPELERAYTIAFDTPGRKLDVGWLALLIGGFDLAAREQVVHALASDQVLRRYQLVALGGGPHIFRSVRLADRVTALLRGHDALDETIVGYCKAVAPRRVAALVMPTETVAMVTRALALDGSTPARVMLVGADAIGKASLVEAIATEAGRSALRVDLALVLESKTPLGELIAATAREAGIRHGVLILDGGAVTSELDHATASAFGAALRGLGVPVVLVSPVSLRTLVPQIPELVEVVVPAPGYRERGELWRRALAGSQMVKPEALDDIAGRYSFGGGVIDKAAHRAITAARLRDPDAPVVRESDLVDAARMMFSHRLGNVAQQIPPGFTWEDLVLPEETTDQILEVVQFARLRPRLFEEWGFGRKLPYGRGVSAILAGPPGTGKTMVAQLLAKELGYDLYRIDLSQVVNKYIGETEKSLARIFSEAENSHAVLFFDEADSLFAKRTEVKSSNDRYANLEVNYLLQRMETFDGVTLLATNIEQGIDEAFKRRVRFTIQFELPDEIVRASLWRSMVPSEAPVERDIDWEELARRYEMSGGYIKKAALRAALTAAEANRPLSHADLMKAASQEYREMGRVTSQ